MKSKKVIAKTDVADQSTVSAFHLETSRREFITGLTGAAVVTALNGTSAVAQTPDGALNIARVAVPSSFTFTSENKISALNDGFAPANSFDRTHGVYAVRRDLSITSSEPWVQYEWSVPVTVDKIEVYWAVDHPRPGALPGSSSLQTMHVPQSYRILYWNGSAYVPVNKPQGLGVAVDAFNVSTFEAVKTSKLRLELTPQEKHTAGILEWRVYNFGPVPSLPPVIEAGVDRSVVLGGQTYLER